MSEVSANAPTTGACHCLIRRKWAGVTPGLKPSKRQQFSGGAGSAPKKKKGGGGAREPPPQKTHASTPKDKRRVGRVRETHHLKRPTQAPQMRHPAHRRKNPTSAQCKTPDSEENDFCAARPQTAVQFDPRLANN